MLAEVWAGPGRVDTSALGPGWQPVDPAEFAAFDRLSPQDAAVAEQTVQRLGLDRTGVVDAWVQLRGVPFAVAAFTRFSEILWSRVREDILLRLDTPEGERSWSWQMALRLADLVRSASEDDYQSALAEAEYLREHDSVGIRSAVAAFLFAERLDWCDAAIQQHAAVGYLRHGFVARALFAAVTSPEQVRAIGGLVHSWEWTDDVHAEATLITVGGPAAAAFLAHRAETKRGDNRRKMNLLARLPGDEAVLVLLDDVRHGRPDAQKALLAAGKRFPRRTLRLLAAAQADEQVALTLRLHVQAHPEVAAAMAPELDPESRARIEAVLTAAEPVGPPADSADGLPAVLVTAPWLTPKPKAKPIVIKGLVPPPDGFAWLPGERERWAVSIPPSWRETYSAYTDQQWQAMAEAVAAGRPLPMDPGPFVTFAPENVVRPLLASWQPAPEQRVFWDKAYLARFEKDALPFFEQLARELRSCLLQPVTGVGVTEFMIGLLRVGYLRRYAEEWFGRNGDDAVRCLVPAALAQVGRPREQAGARLRSIADHGWSDPVTVTREAYGPEAAIAVEALLQDRPGVVPKVMPTLPPWAAPDNLPPIVLADGSAALPPEAVRIVLQMLSISKPGAPYPDLAAVRAVCDRASLAGFVNALFDFWSLVAYPATAGWVLAAQGVFGDDDTVERLTPLIRAWPGEGAHARAVVGLDVLAAIGSDPALRRLHGLSLKGKFKALKSRAAERMSAVAEERGLTADQLADRLVPDLGLSAEGTVTLDYGPRQFAVAFDEALRLVVRDAAGRPVKNLPKPGVNDDPELAPAAYQRFSALKKEVRVLAQEQLWRLELAMCLRRRWSPGEFADLLAAHPVLRHVVRRLIWGVYEQDVFVGGFRVAEDLTYADIEDARYEIPEGASIGVAHPLELGSAVAKWGSVFADYEILQPFAQLDRPVFELTPAERDSPSLTRFSGAVAQTGRLMALEKHGWRSGGALVDAGIIPHFVRLLPDGGVLTLPLDPGIYAGDVHEFGPQTLSVAWIGVSENEYLGPPPHATAPMSRIDAVTMSEIIRELTEATAP
jgi:hypothetical protein